VISVLALLAASFYCSEKQCKLFLYRAISKLPPLDFLPIRWIVTYPG